ncbi:hypothetical protein EV401DRAFT_1379172 [Pisolithus croceorrhizus]|nr:hypothetical protein EV401DRAFT_1379172 [Pisolithus croceorrhizus]
MTQPPASKLTLRGLLTLPYRLCNPPPAVGKVRSCSVTPVLQVSLDDVLDRKHLPPLGLKDFEEYLLYVEQAPENLYFLLWLREYTIRYQAWAQRAKATFANDTLRVGNVPSSPRRLLRNPPPPDPSLTLFYSRAKQTFFTPFADYELNIPSDILGPFHSSASQSRPPGSPAPWHSQSAHPDPAVFTEVAIEARFMLNESLQRFVHAASTNVGSRRAACGIAGGTFFTLVTGVLPLVMTTGRWNAGPHSRFIRLAALPGLWFGLTILIASLQGICLMIYVFGDLRQLRRFELARPMISRPLPTSISEPFLQVPRPPPLHTPIPSAQPQSGNSMAISPATMNTTSSAPPDCRRFSSASARSSRTSCESCEPESACSDGINEIEISAAVFDDDPAPEGPATATCLHRPEYQVPPPPLSVTFPAAAHLPLRARPAVSAPNIRSALDRSRNGDSIPQAESLYGPTAGFIQPSTNGDTEGQSSSWKNFTPHKSRVTSQNFDFDLLPSTRRSVSTREPSGRPRIDIVTTASASPSTNHMQSARQPCTREYGARLTAPSRHSLTTANALTSELGRAQYKCNKRPSPISIPPNPATFLSSPIHHAPSSPSTSMPAPEKKHRNFPFPFNLPSFTAGVPAFAAPLTNIQSPVVKRAQWEVVVRSGMIAFLVAGAIVGVIVGVVP